VILGRKGQGPLGVEWSDDDYWVIDTAYSLVPLRSDIDLRYAYYLIKFVGLNHLKDGTSNPTLSRDTFGAQALPLPPPSHQRAIAHILGALDDKIELNRRMSETLEATARALFTSWFVNFDPVRAKVEGREPGLPKPIADLFPAHLVDSELGEIPDGWAVRPVGDIAEVVGGSTPSTARPDYWEGGFYPWATPKDLSSLSVPVLLDTERKITEIGLAQIGSGLLPEGTVLLSSRAPIGYLAIAEVPTAINQGFIAMKPRQGVPSAFLLLWAHASQDRILSRANGSTFLEISKSNFRPIPVVTPTPQVMSTFERLVEPAYRRIVSIERESHTLVGLRDALLPKLVSGEIRVEHPGRILGGGN
jgi:type I restriction enzyme S subunit